MLYLAIVGTMSILYITIYLLINLIVRAQGKKITKSNCLDILSAIIISSCGFLIYKLQQIEKSGIPALDDKIYTDINWIIKTMLLGIRIGGGLILCFFGVLIIPFVFVHEIYVEEFDLPEKGIFKLYTSMCLLFTASVAIIALLSLTINKG